MNLRGGIDSCFRVWTAWWVWENSIYLTIESLKLVCNHSTEAFWQYYAWFSCIPFILKGNSLEKLSNLEILHISGNQIRLLKVILCFLISSICVLNHSKFFLNSPSNFQTERFFVLGFEQPHSVAKFTHAEFKRPSLWRKSSSDRLQLFYIYFLSFTTDHAPWWLWCW